MEDEKKVTKSIVMLYVMNIAQLVLPLVTLPYLTRVLSTEDYGVVSYVKSVMVYATLVIEFGFILSGTRDVVQSKRDPQKVGKIIGRITQGKLLLSLIAFVILFIMSNNITILRKHQLFTFLSFGSPFLSIFLFDYLFRGLEKMQIVTTRYLIMKGISTVLTFVFIKDDAQLNLIPVLDIIGSLIAGVWVFNEIKKMNIKISFDSLHNVLLSLKTSFTYFISDIATTAFSALNTIFVGIYLSATKVAIWGLVMLFVSAVQTMYTPISDGIYPRMVAHKSLKLFIKILLFFIPFLIIGSLVTFFYAKQIMLIIGGHKYIGAYVYLRESIPLLIISFFSILFGWPLLGAIDKVRETTFTTVSTAFLQVVGICILIFTNHFSIGYLILTRIFTEFFMAVFRITLVAKYRDLFTG